VFDHIDPRSPTPLYAQIAERIRLAIATAELGPGAGLPSVRQLAAQLRVPPATIVQAYRALESEGFVELKQGAGTFVRDVASDRRAKERARQAVRLVRDLLAEAGRLGVSTQDLAIAIEQELGAKTA
jgi:GntR family transcriptional regulator